MQSRLRTMDVPCRMMMVGLMLCIGGCADTDGQGTKAPTREYSAARVEALWKEVEQARRFSFDAPERKSGIWRASYEREALLKIVEECPGWIDEARARLRLARVGNGGESNRARHQVVLAQQILEGLMEHAPKTLGLMGAVAEATHRSHGFPDQSTPYYRRAHEFLDSVWRADGPDAAEAGFYLADLELPKSGQDKRVEQYEQVAEKYPESDWGIAARLRVIRLKQRDGEDFEQVEELLEFADAHAGKPLGGEALMHAAYCCGTRSVGRFRDRPESERLEKAAELYLRFAEEYPDWPEQCEEYWVNENERGWQQREIPSIGWGGELTDDQLSKLETFCQQYFALRPYGKQSVIYGVLSGAKGFSGDEARRRYSRVFWAEVEKLAAPALKDAALAAEVRSHFYYSYSEETLAAASEALDRLIQKYPNGQHVPPVMDEVARNYIRHKRHEEAATLWRQLLREYPGHPLARVIALDLAYLEYQDAVGEQDRETAEANWREALGELLKQYPDDVVVSVVAHYHRAESFARGERYEQAKAEYQDALEGWPALAPGGGGNICLHPVDLADLDRFAAGKMTRLNQPKRYVKDTDLYGQLNPQTPADKIRTYQEVVEKCPDSPRASDHLFRLGRLLVSEKRYDEARRAFEKHLAQFSDHPGVMFSIRVRLLRLDYLKLGNAAEPLTQKAAVKKLVAAVREYDRAMIRIEPEDAVGRDVMSLMQTKWPELIAEQLKEAGQPTQPRKWFLLDGRGDLSVELFDGQRPELVLSPTYKNAFFLKGMAWHLSETLGMDQPEYSAFVKDVARQVFLFDDTGKLVKIPLHRPYCGVRFYDKQRHRVQAFVFDRHPDPHDDIAPVPIYLQRSGGEWTSSDAKGWFTWSRHY